MHLRRLPTALGEAISDRKIATSPLRAEIPAVTRVGRRLVVKRLSRRSLETRPPMIRDDRPGLLLSQVLRWPFQCSISVAVLQSPRRLRYGRKDFRIQALEVNSVTSFKENHMGRFISVVGE